jgi:hypothetical protein
MPEERTAQNLSLIQNGMQKNFEEKLKILEQDNLGKVFSQEWSTTKQVLISSHWIYLYLTYEEDEMHLTRYITDIEILRK